MDSYEFGTVELQDKVIFSRVDADFWRVSEHLSCFVVYRVDYGEREGERGEEERV